MHGYKLFISLIFVTMMVQSAQAGKIHEAVWHGDEGTVAQLLASQEASLNDSDGLGRTPLHIAIEKEFAAMTGFLLANGSNPNIPDMQGRTAVSLANASNNQEIKRLVRAYAETSSSSSRTLTVTNNNSSIRETMRICCERSCVGFMWLIAAYITAAHLYYKWGDRSDI